MVSLVTWEIGAFDVSRDRDSRDRHESIQLWGTSTQNSKFLICVQCYSLLWPEGNFLDKYANKACLQSTAYVAQIDNIFKFTVNHKFPRPSDPDVMLKTVLVWNMMLYFVAWQCALLNHAASEYLHCHALTRQDVVSPGCTHHCLSENPTWEYLNRIRYPTISNMPGKVGDVMWYQSAFRTWHSLSLFCNSSISNCSFGGQSLLGPPIRKLLVILGDSRSSQFFPIRQRCIFSKLGHHLSFCSALFNSTCILSFAVVGYQEQRLRSTEKKNCKIYVYYI